MIRGDSNDIATLANCNLLQGANAQGKYQLGTAPCSASSCNLTSGTGANYRVNGGTLRLAQ